MSDPTPEAYPMPLFVRLSVDDVGASTDWYRAMGFDAVYSTPGMAHVRYRRYADLMLVADPERGDGEAREPRGRGVSIYVTLEDDPIEAVAERAREHGAAPEGPTETEWNTREVVVHDPDGYELVFSAVVDPGRSFEEVVGAPEATHGSR